MSLNPLLKEFNGIDAKLDKYAAIRIETLKPILCRLLETDREAFEAMLWLVWWVEHKSQGCEWREHEIARLFQKKIQEITPD